MGPLERRLAQLEGRGCADRHQRLSLVLPGRAESVHPGRCHCGAELGLLAIRLHVVSDPPRPDPFTDLPLAGSENGHHPPNDED